MSTQIDYYTVDEGEFKWWQEEENPNENEPEGTWIPPKTPDLLKNVHMNHITHIKSPFYHRRYPYEFKTPEYFKYKSCKSENNEDHEKKSVKDNKCPKKNINLELNPVKKTDFSYRSYFNKKSLRQRIYDGEVFFYEDYVEYNIAKDFCKMFGIPFNVPRQDWGGQNYYFGRRIPDENLSNEKVEVLRREATKLIEKTPQDNSNSHSETDALIMSTDYLDEFKRNELLKGQIPSLFESNVSVIKNKPRKDRWVSFHNLKNYGLMIDSVTKCPLIQVQLQSYLQTGWNTLVKGSVLDQSQPGGRKKDQDPYTVSEDQLKRANEILSERRKKEEDPLPDITKLFKSKSYGINENCYTIGGGRYRI